MDKPIEVGSLKRFVTTYVNEDGDECGGFVDAYDFDNAQEICDSKGKGETVQGVLFAIFPADDSTSPSDISQLAKEFMKLADNEAPDAITFDDHDLSDGSYTMIHRNGPMPNGCGPFGWKKNDRPLPLFDWQIPPAGRAFTYGTSWGRLIEWLHGTVSHVLVFGVIPTLWFCEKQGTFEWKASLWSAAALVLARAVMFGLKPTIVGADALSQLIANTFIKDK